MAYLDEVIGNTGGDGDKDEKSKTAFERLVLPDGHKTIMQSLVAQHYRNKDTAKGQNEQTDIVRGKGISELLQSPNGYLSPNIMHREGPDTSPPWGARRGEN